MSPAPGTQQPGDQAAAGPGSAPDGQEPPSQPQQPPSSQQPPQKQQEQEQQQAPLQARVYQLELLELAKNRNVIAFLDTGSGKTFISVLLIKHCVSLVKRNPEDRRVAVFLAPKVALVVQQSDMLRMHTPYRVGAYVGEMGVDLWERRRWREEWAQHDVLVMTPQILLNLLRHAIVKLSEVHLLVFDECHHAHKGHPYNGIMQEFYHSRASASGPRPHIFGMTASPANIRRNQGQAKMEANIRLLEANLHAKVVTVVNRDAVERVAPPPTLRVVEFVRGPWGAAGVAGEGRASAAPAGQEGEQGGPVEEFMAQLRRARRRLQCAADYFEIKWQEGLHRQLGMEGVGSTAERVYFDPSVPGTTASKLDQMLGSVQHVVEGMGPWCGAVCFLEVLKSLLQSNPTPYWYLHQQQGGNGGGGGGRPRSRDGRDSGLKNPLDIQLQGAAQEKLQALVTEVLDAGFSVAEVEHEQDAANLSTAEVLVAFGELLLLLPLPPASEEQQQGRHGDGAATDQQAGSSAAAGDSTARWHQFQEMLTELQQRVAHRQLLRDLPVRAMKLVLGAISQQQLQDAVLLPGSPQQPEAVTTYAIDGTGTGSTGTGSTGISACPPGQTGPAAVGAPTGLLKLLLMPSSTAGEAATAPAPTAPAAAVTAAGPPTGTSEGAMEVEEEEPLHALLVTPKLRALVHQLLLYREAAAGTPAAGQNGAGSGTAAAGQNGASAGAEPAPSSSSPSPSKSPSSRWSAIVFVTQRMASWALHSALKSLPCLSFLRTSAIMGSGARVGEGGYGVQEQSRILKRFRSGELNLLISTAVAEEGIDVKSCQLVVRFDLPTTAQSYIQSRGRARMENSELVMMVQRGEPADMQMVSHMVSYEQQLRQEVLLNIERLQAGQLSEEEEEDEEEECGLHSMRYVVPSTGACLTLGNAQLLLNNYVTKLPGDRYAVLRPLFRTEQLGPSCYRSRAFLPNNCPLPSADGGEHAGRRVAIAAAALEACKKLHQMGVLDDHLLPIMAEEPEHRQQKRKAVTTDEVLENKAHEPPVPMIIQNERPKLMKGKLSSLLGQQQVVLHKYRWQPVAHHQDRQQRQGQVASELRDLSGLGVLLMGPLTGGLPPCSLWVADPAEERPPWELQVSLVPDGEATFSAEQFSTLLACHGALLRHMFSKGPYCGAAATPEATAARRLQQEATVPPAAAAQPAAEQPASQQRPAAGEASAPQVSFAPPSSTAKPAPTGGGAGAAAERQQQRPTQRASRSKQQQQPGAAGDSIAEAVEDLVLGIMNRLVLLHDGVPLMPRKEDTSAPQPGDTPFLLVPCLTGSRQAGSIDWGGVQEILERDSYEGTALGLLRAAGTAALEGRVLVTEYNRAAYLFRSMSDQLTLSSPFPADAARLPYQERLARKPGAAPKWWWASAAAIAEADPDDSAEAEPVEPAQKRRRTSGKREELGEGQEAEEPPRKRQHTMQPAQGRATPEWLRRRPESPLEPKSYQEYYEERWGRRGLCLDQPLLLAGRAPRPVLLAERSGIKRTKRSEEQEGGAAAAQQEVEVLHLVPELCLVCPVPYALWRPLAMLPRLMWHTEAALQAAVLRGNLAPSGLPLDKVPSLALIRTALTAKSALEGSDYERLETLGDGFIKYAVSVQLFAAHSTYHEGQLTKRKDRLVSNRRLAERGAKLGLPAYLRLLPFSLANWLEPEPLRRSDKVLADGLEAMVGAFLVCGGEEAARAFLQHVGMIGPWRTPSPESSAQRGSEAAGEEQGEGGLESCTDFVGLERLLRYSFKTRALAEEALTHCSWPGSGSGCYQRLEFLGDAVLDVLVTRHFFTSFREATPSKMHDMRSVAVNSERLAMAVVRHGLHQHIRHQSPRLFQHIEQFVMQWRDEVATAMEKLHGGPLPAANIPPPPPPPPPLKSLGTRKGALLHPPPPLSSPRSHHTSPPRPPGRPGPAGNGRSPQEQQGPSTVSSPTSAVAKQPGEQQPGEQQSGEQQPGEQQPADRQLSPEELRKLRLRAEDQVLLTCAFGFEHVQSPKVLSDVLEAVLGAIYVDSGGSLDTVWKVVQNLLHPLVTPSTTPVQPVRHIQELVQRFGILPQYDELGRDPDTGAVHVRLSALGVTLGESFEAGNFRSASRLAARDAVARWHNGSRRELEAAAELERRRKERERREELKLLEEADRKEEGGGSGEGGKEEGGGSGGEGDVGDVGMEGADKVGGGVEAGACVAGRAEADALMVDAVQ